MTIDLGKISGLITVIVGLCILQEINKLYFGLALIAIGILCLFYEGCNDDR